MGTRESGIHSLVLIPVSDLMVPAIFPGSLGRELQRDVTDFWTGVVDLGELKRASKWAAVKMGFIP